MPSNSLSRAAVAALTLGSTAVDAFWRLECPGSIGLARIDPLMDFDGVSGHVHALKGGSAFSAKSTAEDLLKSKCTSCGVVQDKSAYWAPPLYFQGDDGTLTLVPEKPPFKAYYELNAGKTSDGKDQTIEAFPNGFQMIAGDNLRRNTTLSGPDPDTSGFKGPYSDKTNNEREQLAIGFNCMNYGFNGGPKIEEATLYRHHLPEKSVIDTCGDGMRLELQFPSCWNGEMDGGPDHKDHVAYPEWINGGDCPAGFDKRFPQLMFETIVATEKFIGKSGKFVLGNGDPTGYGYHGDFISAWADGALDKAVEQCTDLGGDMKSCPVFEFAEDASSCTIESMPDELKDEQNEGPLQGLPGGCEIQSGPERAQKGKGASGSSSGGKSKGGKSPNNKSKDESSAADKKASSPAADAPAAPVAEEKAEGGVFAELKGEEKKEEKVADYVAPAPAAVITGAPAEGAAANDGGNAVRTEIYTSNGIVYENLVVVKEVTVTEGAAKVKRTPSPEAEHVKRHDHRHEHIKRHGHGGRRLR
ncbi:MAG: hypothetical protein Q9169_002032 [Polycauliona sp. 2 TL-2023]